jgi:hypothetical protein
MLRFTVISCRAPSLRQPTEQAVRPERALGVI